MSNKMIALTRAPYITFHKVPRANVSFDLDLKALSKSFGSELRVDDLKYVDGVLGAVVVSVGGRSITVALTGTDCVYDMRFQQFEISEPSLGNDIASLFNRVR